jgi:hypothetical protein
VVGKHAEEPLPAGIAPVRGKSEQPFQSYQGPFLHAIARDAVQIEVSTPRAMRITGKRNRHTRGVESYLACMAPPGFQPRHGKDEINGAGAMRPKAIHAATLWTNHCVEQPSNFSPKRRPLFCFP